jgi:hypothetical protein
MKYIQLNLFENDNYKKDKRKLLSLDDDKIYYIIEESSNSIIWLKDEDGVSDLIHKCYINKRYKKI